MKDVISEVVEEYGRERVHYSVIIFGSSPDVKVLFSDNLASDERLKLHVQSFSKATNSALDATLQKVKEIFENHARPGVKRVLVVITDKKSDSDEEELRTKAALLEDAKVKVIAVGLGEEVDKTELETITARKDNVMEKPSDVPSKNLAKEIMIEVLKGNTPLWYY